MKKIGVIDHFLDQYHFHNYPDWIKNASNGEMQITYAWAETEHEGGKSNAECCAEHGVTWLNSPEELIKKSDCLIVMSPDNPERHEELCKQALSSGKPTYVDKTFAPDRETALRITELAEKSGTPFFSTSALRYAPGYAVVKREGIEYIAERGPGLFSNYAIHHIEPVVCIMGADIEKIMYIGTKNTPSLIFGYRDGRTAVISQLGWECPFNMAVNYSNGHAALFDAGDNFYAEFIKELVGFFRDGRIRVPHQETLAVMTVLEYGKQAQKNPGEWIFLPVSREGE